MKLLRVLFAALGMVVIGAPLLISAANAVPSPASVPTPKKLALDQKLAEQYFDPKRASDVASDIGPTDLASARKATSQQMAMWREDSKKFQFNRFSACTSAWLEGTTTDIMLNPNRKFTVAMTKTIQQYLREPAVHYSSVKPLEAPWATFKSLVKAGQIKLTVDEQKAFDRLYEVETEDLADRVQLSIDTESFLMRVSSRQYDEEINNHLAAARNVLTMFQFETNKELCAAYRLRIEKDNELVKAGSTLLAFYDELDVDMRKAGLETY